MANIIKVDNALLRRQKQKEKRVAKNRKVPCRILIVSEGEKTEPNYFRKFCVQHNAMFVYEVTCEGTGENTVKVVDKAISLRDSQIVPYDSVWAVFDRDSFPTQNFNAAISKANANGINVAWSNEAFELWYLYHFQNRVTAMNRDDYKAAISKAINNTGKWKGKKPYKYAKNDEQNYAIMTTFGDMDVAIKNAQKQHASFTDAYYASHNPCTTVYKLVLQLLNRDKELIDSVMRKINPYP